MKNKICKRNLPKRLTALVTVFSLMPIPSVLAQELPIATTAEPSVQMVPIRAAVNNTGGTIGWNAADKSISIEHDKLKATITVGSNKAIVDGKEVTLSAAPMVGIKNRAMVPYDFVRDLFVADSDENSEFKDYLVPRLYEIMEQRDIAGLTVSFVDLDTNTDWQQGFGFRDTTETLTVDKDTLFEIGSISKTFTALGIMQQAEQGKISLSDPVSKHLPEFSILPHPIRGGDASKITIEMLGKHTSGIPGTYVPHFMSYNPDTYKLFNNTAENISELNLSYAPGDSYAYSNMGVSLLGYILAKTTGGEKDAVSAFTDYQNENIFGPIGMTRTSFLPQTADTNISKSYFSATTPEIPASYLFVLPSGSVTSSAKDMSSYLKMLLNKGSSNGKQIISSAAFDEMLTISKVGGEKSYDVSQAFIWQGLKLTNGKTVYYHDGATNNFFSLLAFIPEDNLGFFISENSKADGGQIVMEGLTAITKADGLKNGEQVEFEAMLAAYETPEPAPAAKERLDEISGYYSGVLANITPSEDGNLVYSIVGMENGTDILVSQKDGSFIDSNGTKYFFEKDSAGIMVMGYYNGKSKSYYASKLPAADISLARDFIGSWTYVNQNGDDLMASMYPIMHIAAENGHITMRFAATEGPASTLIPTDGSTCYLSGYGRAQGDVLKLTELNGKPAINYCGGVFVKAE